MVQYIINTIAFQLFFLIIYDLFLKKETFFNWNRFYLIGTSLLALVIPFIKINRLKEVLPQEFMFSLPEIIVGNTSSTNTNALPSGSVLMTSKSLWSWETVLYIGMLLATFLLLFKVAKLVLIISKNPKSKIGNLFVVSLLNSHAAFSCFHYIFLGEQINEKDKAAILKHEMVHVKQRHTLDLLFFEALRILFWFNPLVYMYQSRMMQLHEFIADKQAIENQNKKDYYENLLSQFFQTKNISFINPFFKQSLIKKRIVMLQKSKSKKINLLKYALLVPMIMGMLIYTSCGTQKSVKREEVPLTDQINQLKSAIEHKGEITSEEEKQAMKNLSVVLNKTKYANRGVVPFSVLDRAPIFPECKDVDIAKQKACFSRMVSEHVNRNFNTKKADSLNLKGRQRINVIFKINKEGGIVDVRSRAPHKALEAEAVRVIKTLPKMVPGEYEGKKVNTFYSLPIIFEVKSLDKENG
ncbi:M56 family metallopeptidase [Flavivirga algicola]|uniref:BlaR1 peptidase M56 family protein n=1 Tax=Flavivirga algicola TaxID=2729136 RepID=A0ABX1RUI7_9FLAO|nr:M56 family metallopeptidase [Flavivirga algicola]NMH87206.1 blaR1 peptidase M56 family protein [Flavivirga algicola]